MNINRDFENFYPRPFSTWSATKTTESVDVVAGNLTIGNIYFISKSGGNSTNFDGAISNTYGEAFQATGTNAIYDGAELVDITNGKPTEIGYFYGHPRTMQFKWTLGYNSDGDCMFTNVLTPENVQLDL